MPEKPRVFDFELERFADHLWNEMLRNPSFQLHIDEGNFTDLVMRVANRTWTIISVKAR